MKTLLGLVDYVVIKLGKDKTIFKGNVFDELFQGNDDSLIRDIFIIF